MVPGVELRLVVADGRQCLRGSHRRLRLRRWIEVVKVQTAAHADFVVDHLFYIAFDWWKLIYVHVDHLVERQMRRAHYLPDHGGRHVVVLLIVVQNAIVRYTLLRPDREKYIKSKTPTVVF